MAQKIGQTCIIYEKLYNDRTLSPLEQITELCLKIRNMDYHYQNLNSEISRAKKEALEILDIYVQIILLISKIHLKDFGLLIKILDILRYSPLNVLGDQLSYIKLQINNENNNLYQAIQTIAYNYKLAEKYKEYLINQYYIQYQKEINLLEKKGMRIIHKYHEWYIENIYDIDNKRWRKRYWNETPILPWD